MGESKVKDTEIKREGSYIEMLDKNTLDLLSLIDEIPVNIYIKDVAGNVMYCNQSQVKSYNLSSKKEVLGKTDLELSSKKEYAIVCHENDLAVIMLGEAKSFEEKAILNNTEVIMLSHKIPVRNRNGAVIGIFGISIDISEQKEKLVSAELEKNMAETALENIISKIPGHIYWQDLNNVFLGCNLQQALDAGLKAPNDIIGKTNYEMPWRDEADNLNRINNQVMTTQKEYSIEEPSTLANGEEAIFLSKKAPLYNQSNEVIGIVGVSIDITEQKKLERELQEKNKELEKIIAKYKFFISNQQHDMITPSGGVLALSQDLAEELEELGDPELITLSSYLKKSGEALFEYHKSLLDSIYLENDETESYSRRFKLKALVEQVYDMYLSGYAQKKIKFHLNYKESMPQYWYGDTFRIQHSLCCLLSNAMKFTKEGGTVELSCSGQPYMPGEFVVSFKVCDNGLGIPKEQQETIFEPFSKLTLSNTGRYKGRGLGLALVKKMIGELQGEIEVESEIGKGSVFRILLPLKISLAQDTLGNSVTNRED